MWAWIIPILVEFLVKFLEAFLQNWLNPQPPPSTLGRLLLAVPAQKAPLNLANGRQAFTNSLKWKFWYGPQRLVFAAQLYDKASARFNAGDYLVQMSSPNSAPDVCKHVAQALCEGLTL